MTPMGPCWRACSTGKRRSLISYTNAAAMGAQGVGFVAPLRLPGARHAFPVLTVLLAVDHHAERRPDHARSTGENDGRGTRLRRHQSAHADPHAREEAYRLQEDRLHHSADW